jgi:cell wall assembly regulator SMI1
MLPLLVRHADIAQFREALAHLDVLLVADEREFAASLKHPATDSEIEALRASLDPYELIEEIELLYRWHNGQDDRLWWSLLETGPLLTASEAVKHRDLLRDGCEPWQ